MLRFLLPALLFAGSLTACQSTPTSDDIALTRQSQTVADGVMVDWDQLTLRPRATEQLAQGPSAVAIGHDGTVLVLDRLAGRVQRLAGDGALGPLATVPFDAEDLAVGPDGAFVAYSPVRATAWLFEADGSPAGSLQIPRALRDATGIELSHSRQVLLRTGYQELLNLGSPSAPLGLPVAIRTKKEGAVLLPDGRGASVVVNQRAASLVLTHQANANTRAQIGAEHTLGTADAGRIIGSWGNVVCVRLEQLRHSSSIEVTRHLRCLDATDGRLLLERALPATGLYLPRRELAVGHGYVAALHPTAEGALIQRWTIPTEVTP